MTESTHGIVYLGPDKGRWGAASWSDVVEAAAGGLLDESHWVDLKQELAAGKATINTDLAKDLASLAVDGGLLVIGIEDHHSHAGAVCGVELAGLADRVDQIARDKVHPSLLVRSMEVPDPGKPGRGCLLVHIPPSAQAPHMVDYVYYGRGDRANIRLSDEQVRSVFAGRLRDKRDILIDLRSMTDDDPIPKDARQNGHLYLLARPETTSEEVLVDFLGRTDAHSLVRQMLHEILAERGVSQFDPDLHNLPTRTRRAEGLAFTTVTPGLDNYESTMLDLLICEDGGIKLTCGRGTDIWPRSSALVVIPALVLGLSRAFTALAGKIGDVHAAYQGQWQLGIRLDGIKGAQASDFSMYDVGPFRQLYTRNEYERVTTACTEQLANSPKVVADQLVAPLLRGLGVAEKYSFRAP